MSLNRGYALVGALLAFIVVAACSGGSEAGGEGPSKGEAGEGPQVVASIYPLFYLTQRIGGQRVHVTQLVPAGAAPHDWEPTSRDMQRMNKADLILYNGVGFEPWLDRVFRSLPEAPRREATAGIDLLQWGEEEREDGAFDPHVWLDPLRMQKVAGSVRDALSEINGESASVYSANMEALRAELEQLDQEYTMGLADCRLRQFIVNHAAFAYLATRYGLEQIAIAGLSPDVEPSSARIRDIVEEAREHDIKHILFETLVSPRVSRTVAREVGARTLVLNPLEGLTRDEVQRGEDYFSVMRQNLDTLKKALECR